MKLICTLLIILPLTAFCQTPQRTFNADFSERPYVKWKFKVNQPILSSPVIDNEIVYFGGCDSTFYALQLKDSKLVWKLKTKGQIRSTVLVDGNFLYLNGGDGNLYKLDKKNGTVLWTFSTKGERKYDFRGLPSFFSDTFQQCYLFWIRQQFLCG